VYEFHTLVFDPSHPAPNSLTALTTRDVQAYHRDTWPVPGASRHMKDSALTSFLALGLAEPITRALVDEQYVTPTPIQSQTIPQVLAARDVVGIAQTGTGKTAAFALPILHHLAKDRKRPEQRTCRVLVLSPTRELSAQIVESFETYGRYVRPRVALAIGGVPLNKQIRACAGGLDVLVATPGRLLDLMQQRAIQLDKVEVFVLDEADRMLDMGFIHDIRRIVTKLPSKRQTLFFSATMPKEIADLASHMLHDPVRVAVTPAATTVERVEQRLLHVDRGGKQALLAEILRGETIDRVLVFTRTKRGADKVVSGWSPPTSRRAASTSRASATSSTSTCRISRRATCIASAAPRAPAPTASRSRSAIPMNGLTCATSSG
jgi:superfamily II DNA/RNA helicase